jgi:excisionase family DNA binding protein
MTFARFDRGQSTERQHRYTASNQHQSRHAMPHEHYQTVKEVADRLKVTEATVRHWIKQGDLRAIDIGKGWRIANTDLELFLERHQSAPRAPHAGGQKKDT